MIYSVDVIKNQLPYKTELSIKDKLFYLKFKYNIFDERIYVDLLDSEENILVEDEPVVFGQMLFARYYIDTAGNFDNSFPKALIIPNYYETYNLEKIDYNNIENSTLYIQELINIWWDTHLLL